MGRQDNNNAHPAPSGSAVLRRSRPLREAAVPKRRDLLPDRRYRRPGRFRVRAQVWPSGLVPPRHPFWHLCITPLERVDVARNITVACASLCQPDPEYSKTSYYTHKERGGCCVEVNPNWDKVPGYKHTEDFCDKLCMP